MRLPIVLLMPLLGACLGGPEPGLEPLHSADLDYFGARVQPILDERCANPSCHGSSARPLEIFSIHQHRLDLSEVFMDGQLSAQEQWLNFQSARAFIQSSVATEDCALIKKPLAPNAGGAIHGGGTQYTSPTDPEILTLMQWVTLSLEGE